MKRTSQLLFSFVASISAVACANAYAERSRSTRLGEHPAIIAARVYANAGYDYASKMYRHPAGLALYLEQPREMGEHPAVLVARAWRKRAHDDAVHLASHPALARFAAVQPAQTAPVPDESTVTIANAQQDARATSGR